MTTGPTVLLSRSTVARLTLSGCHRKLAERATANAKQTQLVGTIYAVTSKRQQQLRFSTNRYLKIVFKDSFKYVTTKVLLYETSLKSDDHKYALKYFDL